MSLFSLVNVTVSEVNSQSIADLQCLNDMHIDFNFLRQWLVMSETATVNTGLFEVLGKNTFI